MTDRVLLSHDPETGRRVYLFEQDGQFYAEVEQPLGHIFDANHEAEASTQGRRFGDWVRAASIPHHLVYHNGVNEAIIQRDKRHLAKFLNDSDNRKFRTSRGRV